MIIDVLSGSKNRQALPDLQPGQTGQPDLSIAFRPHVASRRDSRRAVDRVAKKDEEHAARELHYSIADLDRDGTSDIGQTAR